LILARHTPTQKPLAIINPRRLSSGAKPTMRERSVAPITMLSGSEEKFASKLIEFVEECGSILRARPQIYVQNRKREEHDRTAFETGPAS
jgi:hypothetical protein